MKISRKGTTARWVSFDKGKKNSPEFLVRSFPFSLTKKEVSLDGIQDNKLTIDGDDMWQRFDYCLQDWKKIDDADGDGEFKYNEENKRYIFDYVDEIRNFVFGMINELGGKVEKELKN